VLFRSIRLLSGVKLMRLQKEIAPAKSKFRRKKRRESVFTKENSIFLLPPFYLNCVCVCVSRNAQKDSRLSLDFFNLIINGVRCKQIML